MPDIAPIPIVATGFSWTAIFSAGTFLTVFGGIITLIIRQVGPWKKQTTDAEAKLREEMWVEIKSLRAEVVALRAEVTASHERCDQILAQMGKQHAFELHQTREHHLLELARVTGLKMNEERPSQ